MERERPARRIKFADDVVAVEQRGGLKMDQGRTTMEQMMRDEVISRLNELKAELEVARSDKKAQKQQISEWMEDFLVEHGREAQKEDKEAIRPIFNIYKQLEKRCKDLSAQIEPLESKLRETSASSLADLEPRIVAMQRQVDSKTADRKAQKHRIQDWMEQFKRENGREPTKDDKERVRPMFNRYKDLERECKELTQELESLKQLRGKLQTHAGVTQGVPADMDVTKQVLLHTAAEVEHMAVTKALGASSATAGVEESKLSGPPWPLQRASSLSAKAIDTSKRMTELQERFNLLAEEHQQLAGFIEAEILEEVPMVPPVSTTDPQLGGEQPAPSEGAAPAGAGTADAPLLPLPEGMPSALPKTLSMESSSVRPSLIPLVLQPDIEDPYGSQFGVNSDFEQDARRDDAFLNEDATIPAPCLVDLEEVVLDLRHGLEMEQIPDYMGEFEDKAPLQEVVVAKVPVEELEKREKMMEEVRVQHALEEAELYKKREMDLAWREHFSRSRVTVLEQEARKRIKMQKIKVIEEVMANERALQRHFVAAKEQLERLVYSQNAHFTEKYGTVEQGQVAAARRLLINWDYEPQPIEMRMHLLRAVKNKLPQGHYCILVTPYERLGGNPITWSKLGHQGMGHHRPQATRPVKHKGRFFDTTLRIDQSVFALCPSRKQVRPSNCLIVEMFYLAGKDNAKDQIVGWGVLPICNPRFRIVNGRYKIPLLKGEPTPLIDKYNQIEALFSQDLTHWLCNLYVDIRHLSKEHLDKKGQLYREYDIEYDYINQKLLLGPAPPALKAYNAQLPEKWKQGTGADVEKELQNVDNPVSPAHKELIDAAKNRPTTEEGLKAATDPSHPDYKHHGWAPQSNETWYSKRETLFRHKALPKRKRNVRESRNLFSGSSRALNALGAGTPVSAAGDNSPKPQPATRQARMWSLSGPKRPVRWLSSSATQMSSPRADTRSSKVGAYSQTQQPGSPGGESVSSFGTDAVKGRRAIEDEEAASDEGSGEEEEARSSGDEWVLDGGETRPLLVGREMEGQLQEQTWDNNLKGKVKKRRKRQEGSRWDANGLGIGSTTITDEADPREGEKDKDKEKEKRKAKDAHVGSGRRYEDGVEKLEWFKLNDPQEMEYYSMAVAEDPTKMEQPLPKEIMRSKLLYLKTEMLADLGFKHAWTSEFWVTIAIFVVVFWVRMYVHYLGQYLYLKSTSQYVYTFKALLYMMRMKYISTTGEVAKELSIVLIGPMANILVFIGLMLAGWGMMRFIGQIPDSASKAIAAFGIATLLDPLLIFVIDVMARNYNCTQRDECWVDYTKPACTCVVGDAFKLYTRFQADENNGITGAFITLIIYLAEFLLTGFFLYNYLIFVHMNGRMLDVFKRLHGTSEDFFCPHDFEVTYAEIAYICEKARRWTHPKGTRRRIAVSEYELTDPLEPDFEKEVTTHLAIYNLEIDGSKTLYRHFLRMPDGTIIELFSVEKTLSSQYASLEQLLLSDQNVAGEGARGFFSGMLT